MSENEKHSEKMKRLKTSKQKIFSKKTEKKGLIIVNTGTGKGKSTAGFGMVFRAIAHGMPCAVVQFIKGAMATGERTLIQKHFHELCEFHTLGDGFTWDTQDKEKDIAIFCTGGIRCEKASVYLEKKGFNNVFQLKGGIINYLKKIKKNKSLWKGECYVFDNRISLKHGLAVGTYSMCSGCRKPISIKDKKSLKYEEGVSCPNCHDTLTNSQKERFRMRQKQINVAKKLGRKHIFQKEF